MCGIAGHVRRHGAADPGVAERQLALLCHRGPDSSGLHLAGRAAVGQTRLAVIDLETGDPPISTPDGRIRVALNGEIYNHQELREELQVVGCFFRTHVDTEVIAQLALKHEPVEVARRLNGMFAFAWWDEKLRRLVLGRDRLGKKPLYYWAHGESFVFGSEIKSVLAHPSVSAEVSPDAISAYLSFGYVPSPRTIYDGVLSVPPGHVLVLEEGQPPTLHRYWEPSVPGLSGTTRLDLSAPEAAQGVEEHLRAAVRRRLIADVPLGAFLSGGVDSSAVVALMAQESTSAVRTFTIGFEDQAGFDERPFAAEVARHVGAEHVEFVVQPGAVDLVERLVWHHDQPFGDSSAIPTFLLSELTSQHVTVALCGDGGDELFAGYERFAAGVAAGRLAHVPEPLRVGAASALRGMVGNRPGPARKLLRFLAVAEQGLPHAYRQWISYVPDDLLTGLVPDASTWAQEEYERLWKRSAGAHTLDRLLLLNLQTYLLDDLLPKVDRMSMAHGLEVRAPFLDHELVEFALRLPPSTKMRGLSLKRCLKNAVRPSLPPGLLDRPKRGFGVPLDRWFREDLASYVDAKLGSRDARVRQHLDGQALDALLAAHSTGRRNAGHALWTLLTLEVFLRQHQA